MTALAITGPSVVDGILWGAALLGILVGVVVVTLAICAWIEGADEAHERRREQVQAARAELERDRLAYEDDPLAQAGVAEASLRYAQANDHLNADLQHKAQAFNRNFRGSAANQETAAEWFGGDAS